jgi:catechol 2,3-dioxygenase-like lactoylglutathione lyase family enzyme
VTEPQGPLPGNGEPGRPGIHQIASIVPDLDSTVRNLCDTMGWGPWEVYEYVPGHLRELTVRGSPAEFTWIGAEAEISPGLYVEVLQPTSPDGILQEWLSEHGPGIHHVGYWAPSIEVAKSLLEQLIQDGTEVLLSAWIDDMYFYYLDTRPMIYEVFAGDLESLQAVRRIG